MLEFVVVSGEPLDGPVDSETGLHHGLLQVVDEGPHLFVRLLGRRERARHIVEQTRPLLVLGFQFQNDRDRFMVVLVFLVRTLEAVSISGSWSLGSRPSDRRKWPPGSYRS